MSGQVVGRQDGRGAVIKALDAQPVTVCAQDAEAVAVAQGASTEPDVCGVVLGEQSVASSPGAQLGVAAGAAAAGRDDGEVWAVDGAGGDRGGAGSGVEGVHVGPGLGKHQRIGAGLKGLLPAVEDRVGCGQAVGFWVDPVVLQVGAQRVGVAAAQLQGRVGLPRVGEPVQLRQFDTPLGEEAGEVGEHAAAGRGGPSTVPTRQFTLFISQPDALTVVVALLAGVAGALAVTLPDARGLVGVFVSITTIPAAANMGVAFAAHNWSQLLGAAVQLVVNVICLVIAGIVTLEARKRIGGRLVTAGTLRSP